jgi:hypothetical protein
LHQNRKRLARLLTREPLNFEVYACERETWGKHKWQLCVFKLLEFAEFSHWGHSLGSAVIESNAAILRSRPRCVSYVSVRASPPRALHCVYYPNSKNFIEFGSKLVPQRSLQYPKTAPKFRTRRNLSLQLICSKQDNPNPSELDPLCSERMARKQ